MKNCFDFQKNFPKSSWDNVPKTLTTMPFQGENAASKEVQVRPENVCNCNKTNRLD